jgi:hypothetical protein
VAALGRGGHPRVHLRVVGGGDDVPGALDVGLGEVAQHEGQLAGEALERRGHLGAHQRDRGARGEEGRHPPLGHVAAADDDHLAVGQHQAGEIGVDLG